LSKAAMLRHEFDSVLEMLIEDYSALNRTPSAIPYAQRLIELDPLNESVHRKLMQLYALNDQYPAAIKQYQALKKLLRK
jgi:DNA-binding SARP family transcriptional activator